MKIAATRRHILQLKCTKIDFGRGPTSKERGRDGRGGERRGWEERGGKRRVPKVTPSVNSGDIFYCSGSRQLNHSSSV